MSQGSARIESPEIIRNLRGRFVAFNDICRNTLMAVDASIKRTSEWLKGERQVQLKLELRKCENAVNLAQNEYNRVKFTNAGKASQAEIDAKKALDRQKRKKEETESMLERTKKWATLFDAEIEKSHASVRAFSIQLDGTTPRALSRLDTMIEKLEEYFGHIPPGKA
ncbi:MAG: hypothetical protein FD180_1222 [Planctomycetota bacterium]|nr:MAG: hypothetical protein FD180_1222 [Planctomycetota bacterium]